MHIISRNVFRQRWTFQVIGLQVEMIGWDFLIQSLTDVDQGISLLRLFECLGQRVFVFEQSSILSQRRTSSFGHSANSNRKNLSSLEMVAIVTAQLNAAQCSNLMNFPSFSDTDSLLTLQAVSKSCVRTSLGDWDTSKTFFLYACRIINLGKVQSREHYF